MSPPDPPSPPLGGGEPAAADRDQARLDRLFKRIEGKLPAWGAQALRWLTKPSSRWVRIPAGLFLIVGGVFSFLPVLGLWMLPLGLVLLAQDVRAMRRPIGQAMVRIERWWADWKRRRWR